MTVREISDPAEWNQLVRNHGGHPLQLWGWGELKSAHAWRAYRFVVEDSQGAVGGAQVLQRPLPWPFRSLLYIPRGPVGESTKVLDALSADLSSRLPATHIAIEPDQTEPLAMAGWRKTDKGILLPRTVVLDLKSSQDDLLAAMAKKTRQYIRKSANSGVTVRRGAAADIASCLAIYRQTADRAGFSLHDDDYYYDLHRQMGDDSIICVAEYDGAIVAFLWLVATSDVAFELYGGMNDAGQRVRANYTLKWQTIQAMQARGVSRYDMNGLLNDGVSTFKQSFSSTETQLAGTYVYPLSIWYGVWTTVFPAVKGGLRFIQSLRKPQR